MKVILWAPFGAGTHYWGPGTSAFRLFKSLGTDEIKVTLVHGSALQGDFPDVYDEQIQIGSIDNKGILKTLIFLIKSFFWIYKNKNHYDVFYGVSAFYYTFLPALFFNRYKGRTFIKITGALGGFGGNGYLSKLTGLSRFRLKNANSITGYISISTRIKKNLLDSGVFSKKIFDLPNGVDENRFVPVNSDEKYRIRKDLGLLDKFTFIYLGGLTENKRVGNIIRAASDLKAKGCENFQVVIVGPDRSGGVVINKLEHMVEELNLVNEVVFIPQTKRPELYLQAADVFTLVSGSEGMPNSLLEAMSCGLPAVVTKVSGSEDLIINNHNGIFTSGEINNLSMVMYKYLSGFYDCKMFGIKSRSIIIEKYSSKAIINKQVNLFHEQL